MTKYHNVNSNRRTKRELVDRRDDVGMIGASGNRRGALNVHPLGRGGSSSLGKLVAL